MGALATGVGLLLAYAWVFWLGAPGLRPTLVGWSVLYPEGPLTPMVDLTELLGITLAVLGPFVGPEYWIGSDPSCPISRPDDPFCDPRHVRLYRSPKGHWKVENNKTANGLWLRMAQITVKAAIQFQIGEQQFRLKVD